MNDIEVLEEYTKHDTDLVNLPEYDAKIVYKAIKNLINRVKELEEIEKEHQKTNGELQEKIKELEKYKEYYEDMEEVNKKFISKDKIIEILDIQEDLPVEFILSYIDTLVRENARLEDIEDKKVQIEYQNVFNKGVSSVKSKIKEKIEEYEGLKEIDIWAYEEQIKPLKELLEEENE